MGNITLEIDDQLLGKLKNIALEKKISLDTVIDQNLKEFVLTHQKKRAALEGLEAFYRKCQAKVGHINWSREELHER